MLGVFAFCHLAIHPQCHSVEQSIPNQPYSHFPHQMNPIAKVVKNWIPGWLSSSFLAVDISLSNRCHPSPPPVNCLLGSQAATCHRSIIFPQKHKKHIESYSTRPSKRWPQIPINHLVVGQLTPIQKKLLPNKTAKAPCFLWIGHCVFWTIYHA